MIDLSKSLDVFNPEKYKTRIHIIGCGSVGSTIAELLVRVGIENITLYDFDKVEEHNIANQMFRSCDVGKYKVDALSDILTEINSGIGEKLMVERDGWNGQSLSGFVFLAADSMEVRRAVVEKNMGNPNIKAMFDVRTELFAAQHYAADWKNYNMKKDFLASMDFTDEEAAAETPVSACGVTLGLAPTVRGICTTAVANFMNFWNEQPIKKTVLYDIFSMNIMAFE